MASHKSHKVNIFISYSHKDENHCKELANHLKPLRRNELINLWHDREIKPGSIWNDEIKDNLVNSDIILFLLSSDFLASDYIYENEIKTALELHAEGKSRLVPILVRKCNIEYTPFSSIQCIPNDLTPIESSQWYTVDDAYSVVAASIINIIKDENEKKRITISEEIEWHNATLLNNRESYIQYLKHSKLKTHLDDVLQKISDINFSYYKKNSAIDPLEYQFISDTLSHFVIEIHDNVLQRLSVAKLSLNLLIDSEDIDKKSIFSIEQLIDKAIVDLADLSRRGYRRLNPSDFIIEPEILSLVNHYSSFIKFNCTFSGINSIKNPLLEINLFRMIQEVFNNIFKYSNATTVDFKILKTSDLIDILIWDDGVGFDIDSVTEGTGLKNIKARVKYLNGKQSIISAKGKGTKVSIEIPI